MAKLSSSSETHIAKLLEDKDVENTCRNKKEALKLKNKGRQISCGKKTC